MEHADVPVDTELPKHARWVTRLVTTEAVQQLGSVLPQGIVGSKVVTSGKC